MFQIYLEAILAAEEEFSYSNSKMHIIHLEDAALSAFIELWAIDGIQFEKVDGSLHSYFQMYQPGGYVFGFQIKSAFLFTSTLNTKTQDIVH